MEVEAGDELHAAQNSQRVLHELRRDVAQRARRQVRAAAVWILERASERVVVHGVDGEVASARRLRDGEVGIGVDKKTLVPDAALGLAPWQ